MIFSDATSIYYSVDFPAPIAAYKMEEALGNRADFTGNGNTITQTLPATGGANVTNATGISGNCAYFANGNTSGWLTLPAGICDVGAAKTKTYSMWFKLTQTSAGYQWLWMQGGGDVQRINPFYIEANSQLTTIFFEGGRWNPMSWGVTPTANTWHHVCLVINGNSVKGYYDNVLSLNTTYAGTIQADTTAHTLGHYNAYPNGLNVNVPFTGYIDEVAIFNTALTASQVSYIYSKPSVGYLASFVDSIYLGTNKVYTGYDSRSVAYFNNTGITDTPAKDAINTFVKGLDTAGLWSSIACWPLLSTQNASGVTKYSLGGLTGNATLNGSTSTVVTTGLKLTSADYLTTSITPANLTKITLGVVVAPLNNGTNDTTSPTKSSANKYIQAFNATTATGVYLDGSYASDPAGATSGAFRYNASGGGNSLAFLGVQTYNTPAMFSASQDYLYANSTISAITGSASTNYTQPVGIGLATITVGTTTYATHAGVYSFAFYINRVLTNTEYTTLYALVKALLSANVTLP